MTSKKSRFDEIKFLYLLSGLVFLATLILAGWFGWGFVSRHVGNVGTSRDLSVQEEKKIEEKCNFRCVLDGVCVKTEKEVNPAIVAVMIDNHPDGRPPSGLADASVVYEAPVEANYTRFLAIYPADVDLDKVGPVRSARPYFLDWVKEYSNAMYMHCGGSNEALSEIESKGIFDLNEFYRGWYYWRDFQRLPPHQIYTSSQLWNKALNDYGDEGEKEYNGWKFTTTTEMEIEKLGNKETASQITISFLSPVYEAVWRYSASTGQYERYQMEDLHQDESGKAITADTLIIQRVKAKVIDEVGRQEIDTIGKGEVLVFFNGKIIEGEWRKDSLTSRTNFYDEKGNLVLLKPGKIWVEIASQSVRVEYK